MCIFFNIHTYIHRYIHTFIHTYLHTYLPTYIHTHAYIYINIIYICINMCMHIYIIIYIYVFFVWVPEKAAPIDVELMEFWKKWREHKRTFVFLHILKLVALGWAMNQAWKICTLVLGAWWNIFMLLGCTSRVQQRSPVKRSSGCQRPRSLASTRTRF